MFQSAGSIYIEGPDLGPMLWVRTLVVGALVVLGGIFISWLLFARRGVRVARGLAVACPIAGMVIWSWAFTFSGLWPAHAKALPETETSQRIRLSFGAGCFERLPGRPEPIPEYVIPPGVVVTPGMWFAVRRVFEGMPEGARLVQDRLRMGWDGPSFRAHDYEIYTPPITGRGLQQDFPSDEDGVSAAAGPDGVLEGRFSREYGGAGVFAPKTPYVIHYRATLVEPVRTFDIKVGEPRRAIPGLGYCEAASSRPAPEVLGVRILNQPKVGIDCFIPGEQPDLVVFEQPGSRTPLDCDNCKPSYRPHLFERLGGRHYKASMPIRDEAPATIRMTTYAATARMVREARSEGPWGAATCTAETLPPIAGVPDREEGPH